jgi:biotin transporter BioY
MLGYTLTFLLLASLAGLLHDRSADVAWVVLATFFVLTFLAAIGQVIDGIDQL